MRSGPRLFPSSLPATAATSAPRLRPALRAALVAALCLLPTPPAATAAGIPAPPHVLAMWNGKDGASVRAELRRYAAAGERAGATAADRLNAGESAYWLGVQHALAGRPDSALVEWRRAVRLRGDFDEGFALIDALFRRGGAGDLREARGIAQELATQSNLSMPLRAPEANARLAWALDQLGHADSARAELRDHCADLYRRPVWTRRFAEIELAAGDTATAWRWLVVASARARRRDPELETLVTRVQHALRYSDERRQLSVDLILDRVTGQEQSFASSRGGRIESLNAKDGFPLQCFTFAAAPDSTRRAPCLFVLSPADTVAAMDSLVAALTRAGHPVVLLAPRGTFGSLGTGAYGPEAWLGREAQFEALTTSDALRIMDGLGKRADFAGGAWIVGAVGDRAPAGLAVARARKNAGALLLLAPRVPMVEVAEYRARLRALKTRTYVQVSPEEPTALEFGDLLARDTLPGQVRVADSGLAGRGAAIFRGDPKVAERLLAWLAEKPAAN
jgi:hypothetical protein